MTRPLLSSAILVVLCAAAGCSHPQPPAAPADDASTPATDVMKMAALCHEHGGSWVKGRGCRMTERLCTATYHGIWQDPSCAIPHSEIKATECNRAGGEPTTSEDACLIYFLNLDASQYMK